MIDLLTTAPARVAPHRPNATLAYVRPRTTTADLNVLIDPRRPETDPRQRTLVAHDLAGEKEISFIFKEDPSSLVIVSPTEMVFRADWEKRTK